MGDVGSTVFGALPMLRTKNLTIFASEAPILPFVSICLLRVSPPTGSAEVNLSFILRK